MSKSVLIIDTPEHCYLCSCYAEYEDIGYCQGITVKRVPTTGKPSWCPLKPYKKVNAIPIEWIKKWCNEEHNRKSLEERLLKRYGVITMLEDWEAECGADK